MLRKTLASSLKALMSNAQKIWKRIPLDMIRRVFYDWRLRLKLIVKMNGEHIENVKKLHKKSIINKI